MNRFVRFIFIIIVLAAVVNLAIVLAANYISQRQETAQRAAQHEQTLQHYERLLDAPCQAYLAVDWQKVGPDSKVLQTAVLIQPFTIDAARRPIGLPVTRFVIAGSSISVEGLSLTFDDSFPKTYDFVRGKTLYLLADVHETDSRDPPRAARTSAFIIPHKIPDAARVHLRHTTDDELNLWHLLGDSLFAYLDHNDTVLAHRLGVAFARPTPVTKTLTNGTLYKIFYDANALVITEAHDVDVYNRIISEAPKTKGP